LIAPYLDGKQPEQAVFSPRQALLERNAERQPHRKSRADYTWVENPKYQEFYNKRSYHKAVTYAIEKANKTLPEGEKIPFWVPYSLRHSAGTAAERSGDWESAEVLLDHAPGSNATARYVHQRFEKSKNLARNRHDPFADLPKVKTTPPIPTGEKNVNSGLWFILGIKYVQIKT